MSVSQPSGNGNGKKLKILYSVSTTEGFWHSPSQASLYDLIDCLLEEWIRWYKISMKDRKSESKRKVTLKMKNASVKKWRTKTFAPEWECLFLRLYRHLVNQHRNTSRPKTMSTWCWALLLWIVISVCTFLSKHLTCNGTSMQLTPASQVLNAQPRHFSCSSMVM